MSLENENSILDTTNFKIYLTLLVALSKLDSFVTSKIIRKTSVFGYATVLNLLYSSYPAVSHKDKDTVLLSNCIVAV